jgi:general secretion pathway protein D
MNNFFKTTLLFTLLFAGHEAQAQFKKYKTGTNFNTSEKKSVDTLLDKAKDSGDDLFGRGTGINTVSGVEKDSRYVNLNPETAFGPEVVTSFDFPNASLVDLTKHMQKLTGINLILDKDLKGKVSIMAPSPITVGDAWKAYLTALNINGYTLVKSGAFYKIVNARDIRYTPTKIYTGNYTPDTENYVMRILPLKNIDSTEVTRSFRPFMSRYGRIIDIKQTNTIIVQDTGSNINRLVRLIQFIDVPGHEETLQIIPVRYSSAQEIAKLLDQILKGGGTGAKFKRSTSKKADDSISKIIAEPRTNSIIAMANEDGAKQLRNLIKKLDSKQSSSSGGQIHVYYLNYGDAEEISKTLSTLVSGNTASKVGGSRFTKNASTESSLFNADVKITADKSNNALVVTASPTDYLTIKEVINKLDVPRDQVYVEGMIMETNVSKDRGFGISIIGAYGTGGTQKAGFTGGSTDLLNVITNNITSLGGLFVGGGAGKTITTEVGGQSIEIQSVNALLTAIATNSSTNVLATPQILALDNTEAVFEVGETVPTPERTNAANGSSSVSIKQQKVALTLKLTPQINKVTRMVKLKIDQKVEDFSTRALPAGLQNEGVATTTRSAVTNVVIRDKDTIAMGGLMRDKSTERESKVPLLGDIPVLGWLFKNRIKNVEKVNLLFFLTPRILANNQVSNARNIKDLLNRRSAHLKDAVEGKDPFGTTVKGLFDKAGKQEQGPLYDEADAKRYRDTNQGPGIGAQDENEEKMEEEPALLPTDQPAEQPAEQPAQELILEDDLSQKTQPNYKMIMQQISQKNSAVQKTQE